MDNPIINTIMNRSSVRKYTDKQPDDEVIEVIVRAGLQAPFAVQMYSILLSRKNNPYGAPLLFTFCVDMHKLELIMAKRGWKVASNDLSILIFGIQDVAYAAENMVIAAESLGLGSCFLGATPYKAKNIQQSYNLPQRVFPLVELAMGYPAEKLPPRPRYPLEFSFFEDCYPDLDDKMVLNAMEFIDEGYLSQGYYAKNNIKIDIEVPGKDEAFTSNNYTWTEHNSRRWGQAHSDPSIIIGQLAACGFTLESLNKEE